MSRNEQTEKQRENRSCAGSWEVAEGVGSNRALNLLTAKAQSNRRVEVETHMSTNLQLSEHSSKFSETHSSKISKLPTPSQCESALTGGFSLKLHGASEGRKCLEVPLDEPCNLGLAMGARRAGGTGGPGEGAWGGAHSTHWKHSPISYTERPALSPNCRRPS